MLIPARNEEANIAAALRSVLQSDGVDLEVIVLDDGSTDRTAEIVARRSPTTIARVRLESAQPLPAGWCGKNFACHQLAALARHPLLVFMDADVRVSRPDSLARLAEFVEQSGAALVSGVPREETRGLTEKLIIPLIHFVLLGFLPLQRMRTSTDPRFAAACGQILAVRRDGLRARRAVTPRSPIASTTPSRSRARFRAHGFATDLFDATDTFHCRMYRSAAEVWHGFAKNAHEGLASPQLIVPATLLLLGGQVLPLVLARVRAIAARSDRHRRRISSAPHRSRALPPIASRRAAASDRHLRSRRDPVVRLYPLAPPPTRRLERPLLLPVTAT